MRTYDAWFSRYALRNRLMFFCRLFSPVVSQGSSALLIFLARSTQSVNGPYPCSIITKIGAHCVFKQFSL